MDQDDVLPLPLVLPIDSYHVSPVPASVSALAFDPAHELVHVGFTSGHLGSFCVPGGCIGYVSSTPSFTPILDLSPSPPGIFALAHDCLKLVHRRGRLLWSLAANKDLSSAGLLAMAPLAPDYLALSSTFSRLNIVNMNRGSIVRDLALAGTPQADIRHLCSPSSNTLIAASSRGVLRFIDTRTWRTHSSLTAQTGDFGALVALQDHLILTTAIHTGLNVVSVLDTRAQSLLGSVNVGASLLKPVPGSISCAYAVSEYGELTVIDTSTFSVTGLEQIWDPETTAPFSCLEISSSGDLVAVGDHAGNLHLWCKPLAVPIEIPADQSESGAAELNWYPESVPNVNAASDPIEVASLIQPMPMIPWHDDSVSFNLHIGMPYYDEPLLSGTWPAGIVHSLGLPPPVIPQSILANLRGPPNLRTAPKPASMLRNQWPYKTQTSQVPKFKSTRRRRNKHSSSEGSDIDDMDDYKIQEIKYSKFGVHDFDFRFFNPTEYVGLEPLVANAYVNNYFQALFFTLPKFRSAAIAHSTDTSCTKELCLLCELGYLFRMLEQGGAQQMDVCRAANWCSTFAHVRESRNLNLLESAGIAFPSIASTMATCARFLFDQFRRDADSISVVDELWLQMHLSTRCKVCSTHSLKLIDVFTVDLVYPGPNKVPGVSFLDILSESVLNAGKSSVTGEFDRVWCAKCNEYQPTVQRRAPLRLPGALHINCNVKSDWNSDWWCSKDTHFTKTTNGSRFIPTKFRLSMSDAGHDPTFEVISDDYHGDDIYSLSAVVFEVNQDNPHISSHVKITENDDRGQWYLFNDFRVRVVPESHVVQFPKWKIPSIVMYRRQINSMNASSINPVRHLPLDQIQWVLEPQLVIPKERTRPLPYPLNGYEIKETGFKCAIDTEFVSLGEEEAEFSSEGLKRIMKPRVLSLARVSVVRAGYNAGSVCIDEYVEQRDPVVDYITPFSGIMAHDLNRNTSTRPLVSLKSVYRKLRCIVDAGVVFIGHSLEQDFRIINLVVPRAQVIDTSAIYHIPAAQRKLSLKFLAWAVLGEQVQVGNHDSVEDARTALKLYTRYLEILKHGEPQWTAFLDKVYGLGHQHGFKPPQPNSIQPPPFP